jgi:hypothetical protein
VAAVSGVKGMKTGHRYSPDDYCDELEYMVCMGLSTKEFIARSRPSSTWFQRNVMPICTRSKCHACHKYFNPSEVGMMIECTYPRCPVALSGQQK